MYKDQRLIILLNLCRHSIAMGHVDITITTFCMFN